MALIPSSARAFELHLKIVYWGPMQSGKKSNLQYLQNQFAPKEKSDLIKIEHESREILFFDHYHNCPRKIAGMNARFSVYAAPGIQEAAKARLVILREVYGIVFVADSNPDRRQDNLRSMQELIDNLAEYNCVLNKIQFVILYNKRDLANAMSVEQMERDLNTLCIPSFETVASTGVGVLEAHEAISKMILEDDRLT